MMGLPGVLTQHSAKPEARRVMLELLRAGDSRDLVPAHYKMVAVPIQVGCVRDLVWCRVTLLRTSTGRAAIRAAIPSDHMAQF
jgi:hypothetical protein